MLKPKLVREVFRESSERHLSFNETLRRAREIYQVARICDLTETQQKEFVAYLRGITAADSSNPKPNEASFESVATKELTFADSALFFTVTETAKELEMVRESVDNLIYRRKITPYKFKTLTLLSKSEVFELKRRKILRKSI